MRRGMNDTRLAFRYDCATHFIFCHINRPVCFLFLRWFCLRRFLLHLLSVFFNFNTLSIDLKCLFLWNEWNITNRILIYVCFVNWCGFICWTSSVHRTDVAEAFNCSKCDIMKITRVREDKCKRQMPLKYHQICAICVQEKKYALFCIRDKTNKTPTKCLIVNIIWFFVFS